MPSDWEPIPDPYGDREPLRRRLAQGCVGASGAIAGIATTSLASHPATMLAGAILALAAARLLSIAVRPDPTPNDGRHGSARAAPLRRAA